MAVVNVHERVLTAGEDEVGALVDSLAAGPADRLWPVSGWPAMVLRPGLEEGAAGGHGPVRYTVAAYVPGRWVRFAFTGPRGFDGFHECTVHRADGGRTVLRHTLAMHARGPALLSWPLLFRPLHDALIEDAMDRAERACTGAVARPARWSPLVRLLRRALRAGARRGAG
ncbi:SRPBCC family protein [Kitasatospora sp. NPDC056181]|uniref:SRPBCC family protein n=1 Tax=Kitasatospora sp. NPDC056181 TaxID=3345737 RepID=UPI0035D9915C